MLFIIFFVPRPNETKEDEEVQITRLGARLLSLPHIPIRLYFFPRQVQGTPRMGRAIFRPDFGK